MSTGGLLFIPDISGFSRFVEKTEIEHSQLIIKNLLETLINCNQLQLQVSEIEGDAILFYKFGSPPEMKDIYQQVEKMFCDFHRLLRSISMHRLCQCGACREAEQLTLKVITHQGEFTTYNVREFSKLIGKDVIRVHQLLKNDIQQHEYWLVTDNLYQQQYKAADLPAWVQWLEGSKEIENDQIRFRYTYLSPLKEQLPQESLFPSAAEQGKQPVLTVTKEMDADYMQLFYLVVTLDLRAQWMEGVKGVDKMGHVDNMVGVPHRCLFNKGSEVFITSYVNAFDNGIAYEETTENKQMTLHFEFRQTTPGRTRVTAVVYLAKNLLKQFMFWYFMKRRIKQSLKESLDKLAVFYKIRQNEDH